MAVEFFKTFSDYDRQSAEARRRRAMADLLAQQVAEPMDYGRGPTPSAAPLVRGLQAFLAARAAKKAGEAEEGVKATEARTGEQISNYLFGGGRQPKTAADLTEVTPAGRLGPQTAADLTEVTPEGAYIKPYEKDPAAAFRLALTPAGGAAMKGNPLLAALLAQQMEKPKQLEIGAVDLSKLTPESARRFAASGNPADIEYRAEAPESRIGKPSFGDFTPASLAKYEKTGDPNVLVAVPKVAPTTNIINRYGSPMSAIDIATGQPVMLQPSQTGGEPSVMKGYAPMPSAQPMNEGQANAAGFADRINSALPSLERLSPPRSAIVAEGLPLGLGASQLTDKDQQFFQAERNFITAVLRRESGAAIAPSEFESARRQYIPQPGDGPETLKQKARERRLALENMRRSAGPAYTPSKTVEVDY